jgi:multiple sugar transport system permease protein
MKQQGRLADSAANWEVSYHNRRQLQRLLTYAFLGCVTIYSLYPLFWMVVASLKPGREIATDPLGINLATLSFENYQALLSIVPLWVGFKNTAIVLFFKGAIALFFSPLAGYAFAKFRFRGRETLFLIVLATMMLPPIVLMIPLLLEMSMLGWLDTYQALIFPGAIGGFYIFWMRQQISDIPDDILDAARIDGCSPFGTYWRIVLPIIRPSLAALSILVFLEIYNDFVWPVIAINSNRMQTLQVMLSDLYNQIGNAQVGMMGANAWGMVMAASTLATLPLLLLFVVMQRQFIRGILAGSVKN